MEDLARLVDESLTRYGIQITVNDRWLHAETIYGTSNEIEAKPDSRELATETWAAPHAEVA